MSEFGQHGENLALGFQALFLGTNPKRLRLPSYATLEGLVPEVNIVAAWEKPIKPNHEAVDGQCQMSKTNEA